MEEIEENPRQMRSQMRVNVPPIEQRFLEIVVMSQPTKVSRSPRYINYNENKAFQMVKLENHRVEELRKRLDTLKQSKKFNKWNDMMDNLYPLKAAGHLAKVGMQDLLKQKKS